MKVLVIGGGGREHAIVWKLSQSKKITKLYCTPGNAGIAQLAECGNVSPLDKDGLIGLALEKKIDFAVVSMDDSLALGVVDALEAAGIKSFGPVREAAKLEWSKAWSKELMKKYGIPTAKFENFDNYTAALKYVKSGKFPVVVKADGLAAGKGVVICDDLTAAEVALADLFLDKKFGESGSLAVIEEFMTGPEVSVLAFCDGETVVPMVSAMDHKRAYDGDLGPNTGGMGVVSPNRYYTDEVAAVCMEQIFKPTVEALKSEGIVFKGVIFFGLMLTPEGPKVIEYNARFGDPETQVVLPRLKTDLLDIMLACRDGGLDKINIEWHENAAVCVVCASGGYPGKFEKGFRISGLDDTVDDSTMVFHAATVEREGEYYTNGGRVFAVTCLDKTTDTALDRAYDKIKTIGFKDMHYRKDIGRTIQ